MAQLAKIDAQVAARITDHQRIISFRNVLIHGYSGVNDRAVWEIVQTKLSMLRSEVDSLLSES